MIQCGRQRLLFYFSSPFTRSIYFCTSICGFPVQYRREGGRAPCSPQVKLTDKQQILSQAAKKYPVKSPGSKYTCCSRNEGHQHRASCRSNATRQPTSALVSQACRLSLVFEREEKRKRRDPDAGQGQTDG